MPTLNISNSLYRILEAALEGPKPLSILELRGLGKEAWREIHAAVHVEKERQAWD